ncbi:MAG: hypothetical protein U0W24_03045 [Bacteroidales bacterium]
MKNILLFILFIIFIKCESFSQNIKLYDFIIESTYVKDSSNNKIVDSIFVTIKLNMPEKIEIIDFWFGYADSTEHAYTRYPLTISDFDFSFIKIFKSQINISLNVNKYCFKTINYGFVIFFVKGLGYSKKFYYKNSKRKKEYIDNPKNKIIIRKLEPFRQGEIKSK